MADFMATEQVIEELAAAAQRRQKEESSPAASELSTGKMNPRAPRWNKRLVFLELVMLINWGSNVLA